MPRTHLRASAAENVRQRDTGDRADRAGVGKGDGDRTTVHWFLL